MKVCLVCKQEKDLHFYYNRSGKRKHEKQATCIECSLFLSRNHKRHISKLVKRWKMRKGCSNCNFKAKHSVQLDIDHIIPGKQSRRQAINTSWTKERLKKELSNCQVLCANCHRLKTYNDGTMFQVKDL